MDEVAQLDFMEEFRERRAYPMWSFEPPRREVRQVGMRTRLLGRSILGCRDFESVLSTPADEFLIECFEIQSGTADVVQGIREIDTVVEPVQHLHDGGAVVHAYG